MAFSFTYGQVIRKPNPMVTINPLARGSNKTVGLQDRVDTLGKSAAWKKTIKDWVNQGMTFDMSRFPKVAMRKLGDLDIDEDIQRALDEKHCANKIANPTVFDPALLSVCYCILNSSGKFISIDTQHTVSTVAALIEAGLVPGHTDWREFEFPFHYIETDNLAFARKAFGIRNGKGQKRQSQYMQLRTSVYVVRIDKDLNDPEDVELEEKVATAEKHECFPIDENSTLSKHPGTFTNISTFKSLNVDEIEMACSWHNRYFHYENVHVSLFFIFREVCRQFKSAKLKITPKLQEELAALVQNLFGNLSQFQESVTAAHRQWTEKRYGYQANWDDDAYACALIQLYQHFGGKEKVAPSLTDQFDGLIEFFDEDIMSLAA